MMPGARFFFLSHVLPFVLPNGRAAIAYPYRASVVLFDRGTLAGARLAHVFPLRVAGLVYISCWTWLPRKPSTAGIAAASKSFSQSQSVRSAKPVHFHSKR